MKKITIALALLVISVSVFAGPGGEALADAVKVVLSAAATQPPWITSIEDNRLTELMEETLDFEFFFTSIPLDNAKQQINLLLTIGAVPVGVYERPIRPGR